MDNKTKSLIVKAIKTNLKELDDSGHAIKDPEYYTDTLGLPKEFVERFIQKHYSSKDDPKGMIFNDRGEVLAFLEGVYNLQILRHLASIINPKSPYYRDGLNSLGRGSEARNYHKAITNKLS